MTLGEVIRNYRTSANPKISIEEFSIKSKISKSYISMLENNKDSRGDPIKPSLETINKVAIGMGVSFDDVFAQLDRDMIISIPQEAIPSIDDMLSSDDLDAVSRSALRNCHLFANAGFRIALDQAINGSVQVTATGGSLGITGMSMPFNFAEMDELNAKIESMAADIICAAIFEKFDKVKQRRSERNESN